MSAAASSGGIRHDDLALATGDLDDGARLVLVPLANAARYRFDAAVGSRGNPPEEVDISPRYPLIETPRQDHEVDVAPLVRLATRIGPKQHGGMSVDTMFGAKNAQVLLDGCYNSLISHRNPT